MNMRSHKINLESLQNLVNQGMQKFKKTEDNEFYLIIGNPGLRNETENSRITYLVKNETTTQTEKGEKDLMYPEMHITNENIILCECPDFTYDGDFCDKEEQLCWAISLELALKMAKKIHGILIILDYQDFYVCRGAGYRSLVERLGQLFGSNFDTFFQSAIFVIVNKPKKYSIDDIKNEILENKKESVEYRQNELSSIKEEEANESYKKAKIELVFNQSFISHEKQILVLDESDKGESRSAIISAITEIKPIESTQFKFETFYDDVLKGFNFNLKKFIDETTTKIRSSELQESNKNVINM